MPVYVDAALFRFCQLKWCQQNPPHLHTQPTFGAKVQYATPANDSSILTYERFKYIKYVICVSLYYDISINNTILDGLGDMASKIFVAIANTTARVDQLLDYLVSNPNATTCYHSSGMVLFSHTDASYLSVAKSWSRSSRVYFLREPKPDTITFTDYTPLLNGFVHVLYKVLQNIMALAAGAESGFLFLNVQAAVPIWTTLTEMGHPQPCNVHFSYDD